MAHADGEFHEIMAKPGPRTVVRVLYTLTARCCTGSCPTKDQATASVDPLFDLPEISDTCSITAPTLFGLTT